MKTCNYCHETMDDDAKFCPSCGHKAQESLDDVVEAVYQEQGALYDEPDDNLSQTVAVNHAEDEKESEKEPVVWYYVENNESQGPYSREQMESLLSSGIISGNTYVWKTGMENWDLLKNTELQPAYHTFENSAQPEFNASSSNNSYYAPAQYGISKHNVVIDVIITIVLCGLYEYYWLYRQAKDVNELLAIKGEKPLTSAGMVVLLEIVTCGLYKVYFFWRASNALTGLEFNGHTIKNNTAVLTILSFFLPILSLIMLQTILNDAA